MRDEEQVRHKKRGTTYDVIGEAEVQCAVMVEEGDTLVVYRCHADGRLWARPTTEFRDGRFETLAAAPQATDPLDDLVRRFSAALLDKLRAAERKYGHNDSWLEDDWPETLRLKLREHVEKGDPRDVAAYCAFAWHHGWSIAAAPQATDPRDATDWKARCEAAEKHAGAQADYILLLREENEKLRAALTKAGSAPLSPEKDSNLQGNFAGSPLSPEKP